MYKIFKYVVPFERNGKCTIELPMLANIIDAQLQGTKIVLWAVVDIGRQSEYRHFKLLMTGEEFIDANQLEHIATIQTQTGIVAHLFEDLFYKNKR